MLARAFPSPGDNSSASTGRSCFTRDRPFTRGIIGTRRDISILSIKPPLITFTTDFGLSDSYVAQVKGAILTIAPEALVIDVTHTIPPQDCGVAAAVLADAIGTFPAGTIHLIVVDPGVGTRRRAVAVEARGQRDAGELRFVAPDNGVLTRVLESRTVSRAVQLTESRFWRPSVSQTFHGRDVFGPVAAHWSRGVDLAEFGPPLDTPLVQLSPSRSRSARG